MKLNDLDDLYKLALEENNNDILKDCKFKVLKN